MLQEPFARECSGRFIMISDIFGILFGDGLRPAPRCGTRMCRTETSAGAKFPHRCPGGFYEAEMVNVNGVQPATAPKAIEPAGTVQPQNQVKETINVSDTVEISTVAKLAAQVQQLPEVRTELVQRVKAEIEAGTYETPERLEITVDRLMDELFLDL